MKRNTLRAALLTGGAALSLSAIGAGEAQTSEDSVTNETTQETTSDDPYLWLEEVEGERALDWVRGQNDRSLEELQSSPFYQPMLDEAAAILTSEERIPAAALRGNYAYNFWQDQAHVRGLWRRMPTEAYVAGAGDWDVILDVDKLSEDEGENWVYKGTDCLAPDYDRCLLTLSRGGSDAAVRREFDVKSRSFVQDGFTLEEAKASTAWLDADTLLVGTSTDGATESGYPVKTRLWKRGTPIADAPVVFEGESTDVGVWPFSIYDHERGEHLGGIVRAVTFYDSEHHLRGPDGRFVKLPFPSKVDLAGYLDGQIIVSLNEPWSHDGQDFPLGAVVAYDPAAETAELVFSPSKTQAVQGVSSGPGRIYVSLLDDINGRVLSFTPGEDGWTQGAVDLPPKGVADVVSVDEATGEMLLMHEDPVTPETLYYKPAKGDPDAIKTSPAFYDAGGVSIRQYKATSKDGTQVPYTVIAKDDVLEGGPAPTIQYGYGGFQVPILPGYSGTQGKLWIERGGVYVIANIRGGGEYGPAWHQAGLKGERQRIYDDFYAVSEDLIERGITTPKQLGILGGSNGGLLMGVSMTQRPDLYGAIGIGVPLLDMLRYDKLLAGASWVGEYGDPDDPEERAFLETISPYQNLEEDKDYPRPFFFTSTKDDRVHPGHARKMARKMQANGQPFLYYENIEGGHGAAANLDQTAKRLALQYAYFAEALGLER
ncbi:prolyl oligopeptidase family serine peptidase [Parvularcula dongshanensis]|uniref:Prolyl oligopeptidase n=1 Tax=Parvularcula dongshanensis TaxID=1173995 RepID=A0A840I161_9PROT|nr:prolyl oligopeptidase family serine peptidase [Parvularcula dongshanensis]MBB4658021.1 prolyl oligopeptidase [Parvularcula dongshanensis]